MNDTINQSYPSVWPSIDASTKSSGFTMASDVLTCSLLRTLAASKPTGRFLELGTGTGLSTAWILDGMDSHSSLISIDNDATSLDIANTHLGNDPRLQLIHCNGDEWIQSHPNERFDYIFADTWPGKYFYLDEVLAMLKPGGLYIIDDMLPQPNWPDGHAEKVAQLIDTLDKRADLLITKQAWASGIIIAVKK